MDDSDELQPSRLGTKEHWDKVYQEEVRNFEEFGDEGEIWFGEDSVEKMVDWCLKNTPPSANISCLDIGTGNGTMLIALAENGYDLSRLFGIDYSEDSVLLAKAIASQRGHEGITFKTSDFLSESPSFRSDERLSSDFVGPWDLLLDKGTFDAIALADKLPDGTNLIDGYPTRVNAELKWGGYFLITSCNFTEDELKDRFTAGGSSLKYHSRVAHPTITFGGKTGSTISTVAFQKV